MLSICLIIPNTLVRVSMSQHKPLDPQRWIFSAPKNAGRDLKDPPGHSFSNERDEQSAVNKGSTTNREILEKVC
jgi:hypothetical protein